MSSTRLHVEMPCSSCGSSSVHEILYVGRVMVEVRCSACGAEIAVHRHNLVNDWADDLASRLADKRFGLVADARRAPWAFARALPRRMARQPKKLLDELSVVMAHRR